MHNDFYIFTVTLLINFEKSIFILNRLYMVRFPIVAFKVWKPLVEMRRVDSSTSFHSQIKPLLSIVEKEISDNESSFIKKDNTQTKKLLLLKIIHLWFKYVKYINHMLWFSVSSTTQNSSIICNCNEVLWWMQRNNYHVTF